MELDLKGYLKCTENVKMPDESRASVSEHGSTQGAPGGVLENNITAVYRTVMWLLLKSLLYLPSAV